MVRLGQTTHVDPLPVPGPGDGGDGGDYARELAAWRARCRQRLTTLLGPMPSPVPLRLETLESVDCDGYRRDKVVFDTEEMMSVPAYLLVPDGRVGTASRARPCWPPTGTGRESPRPCGLERTGTPNADYAHQLARRGYVVLAPDLRCFGERLDWNPDGPLRL